MKKLLILFISTISFIACKKEIQPKPVEEIKVPQGINVAYMDTTVRPQDDFYNYVNGNWMKITDIPSDRGRWGSFDELREKTDSTSLVLLKKSLELQHKAGSDEQKVADLYSTIIDTIQRNTQGLDPIKVQIDAIEKIADLNGLQQYLNSETAFGNNPLYNFYVRPHMKNSNLNILYMASPDLGMSRDYYQKDDADAKAKLLAYQGYVEKVLNYIGDANAAKSASHVVKFEKKLADSLLRFEDLRNSELQYNPMNMAQLDAMVANVDFKNYFNFLQVKTDTLIIPEIKYYKGLQSDLATTELEDIKSFLKFNLVNGNANYLNKDLEQMKFDFYDKELKGVKEMRDLDKRALSQVNSTIGQAFGKMYVDAYFPKEAKAKAEEMVAYVKKSFEKHLENVTWMTDSTKIKALDKLSKFNVKIGYPDKWKDYSDLEIKGPKEGGNYYDNMRNYAAWNFKDKLNKIDKEVDKTEWFMPPQIVNAYYSSSFNEIVFPAAIMQPPFYNFEADAAVNFGGIGAVIGHEISHGFDDSGSQYDGDGNYNNWWTPQDALAFEALGDSLAAQYSSYEPFKGIHVNGKSTLGENIADLGGVNVAYDALQMYLIDNGTPPEIQGMTPEERFFTSWATIWRTKSTDEALKNQIKTDFHAPGYYRAIGPLENINAFYESYQVKETDSMYKAPEKRIVIW